MAVRRDPDAEPLADERQDRAGADIGLAGAGWSLNWQYGAIHGVHGGDGARDRVRAAKQIGGWTGAQTRGCTRQQVIHRLEVARPTLIGDHIRHGSGDHSRF